MVNIFNFIKGRTFLIFIRLVKGLYLHMPNTHTHFWHYGCRLAKLWLFLEVWETRDFYSSPPPPEWASLASPGPCILDWAALSNRAIDSANLHNIALGMQNDLKENWRHYKPGIELALSNWQLLVFVLGLGHPISPPLLDLLATSDSSMIYFQQEEARLVKKLRDCTTSTRGHL